MTVKEAYLNLGLGENHHDETTIRKAYYKLAQQFHPDKNSEGRVSKIIPFDLCDESLRGSSIKFRYENVLNV